MRETDEYTLSLLSSMCTTCANKLHTRALNNIPHDSHSMPVPDTSNASSGLACDYVRSRIFVLYVLTEERIIKDYFGHVLKATAGWQHSSLNSFSFKTNCWQLPQPLEGTVDITVNIPGGLPPNIRRFRVNWGPETTIPSGWVLFVRERVLTQDPCVM